LPSLILLTAFSILQSWSYAQFEARSVAARLAWTVIVVANANAQQHAQEFLLELSVAGHQPTIRDAELKVNGGRPFPKTEEIPPRFIFTDLNSANPKVPGCAFLSCRGEVWTGAEADGNDPRIGLIYPPDGGLYEVLTLGRRIAYIAGYFIWLLLFCVILIHPLRTVRKPPMTWAIDLFGIAIVSTTLALIGPNPLRAPFDFLHDDSAGWGLIAIALTLIAVRNIWFTKPANRADRPPQCLACGYNLTGNLSGVCPECGTVTQPVSIQTAFH
jgi:hypothetical protein